MQKNKEIKYILSIIYLWIVSFNELHVSPVNSGLVPH